MADSIVLSGRLEDPLNGLADVGAELRFTMLTNTGNSLKTSTDTLVIDITGDYSFTLSYGQMLIEYKTSSQTREWTDMGTIVVNENTTATNIPELLASSVPPTDANILEFQALLALTEAAADASETSAIAAAASQSATKVSENATSASANASAISANKSESFVASSEAGAELSNKYANNPEDVEVTTGKYSSFHWSEKSRQFATGAISPGGTFTPALGSEYPATTGLTTDGWLNSHLLMKHTRTHSETYRA